MLFGPWASRGHLAQCRDGYMKFWEGSIDKRTEEMGHKGSIIVGQSLLLQCIALSTCWNNSIVSVIAWNYPCPCAPAKRRVGKTQLLWDKRLFRHDTNGGFQDLLSQPWNFARNPCAYPLPFQNTSLGRTCYNRPQKVNPAIAYSPSVCLGWACVCLASSVVGGQGLKADREEKKGRERPE